MVLGRMNCGLFSWSQNLNTLLRPIFEATLSSHSVHSRFTVGSQQVHGDLRNVRGDFTMELGPHDDTAPAIRPARPSGSPKTRWERMQKAELTLDELTRLIVNTKRSEG